MQVERMHQMLSRITQADVGPFKADISAECRDLVIRLLDPDPSTRLTVREALGHVWVIEDLDEKLQARAWLRVFCHGVHAMAR